MKWLLILILLVGCAGDEDKTVKVDFDFSDEEVKGIDYEAQNIKEITYEEGVQAHKDFGYDFYYDRKFPDTYWTEWWFNEYIRSQSDSQYFWETENGLFVDGITYHFYGKKK